MRNIGAGAAKLGRGGQMVKLQEAHCNAIDGLTLEQCSVSLCRG